MSFDWNEYICPTELEINLNAVSIAIENTDVGEGDFNGENPGVPLRNSLLLVFNHLYAWMEYYFLLTRLGSGSFRDWSIFV